MEQSPPAGPLRGLRRLFTGPNPPPIRPRRVPRWWPRLQPYLVPVGLLALIGLGFAAGRYLIEVRGLSKVLATLLATGSVLPAALLIRRPLTAWWVAYPMLFLGTLGMQPNSLRESWAWNPVQIVVFLLVLLVVSARVEAATVAWIGALSVLPVFLYTYRANAYGVAFLFVAIAIVGDQIRRRRQSQRALVEQAELSELEQARRAVLEERTRIARELHDVVAHHMSMIAVRAETAPYRIDGLAEPARDEFGEIATAARGALTDMRRLLGVLRSESTEPQTAPQPGLADLPDLVEAARQAGMSVTLDTAMTADGGTQPTEAVGLTAYRIVQEALANAARHAAAAAVEVTLRDVWPWSEPHHAQFTVRIENGPAGSGGGGEPPAEPLPTPSADRPAGHGLTGMRERIWLLGGEFFAGPTATGGFVVVATLPYRPDEEAT